MTDPLAHAQAVARDPAVITAVREAISVSHPALTHLAPHGEVERVAPREVLRAYAELVATVTRVAIRLAEDER